MHLYYLTTQTTFLFYQAMKLIKLFLFVETNFYVITAKIYNIF